MVKSFDCMKEFGNLGVMHMVHEWDCRDLFLLDCGDMRTEIRTRTFLKWWDTLTFVRHAHVLRRSCNYIYDCTNNMIFKTVPTYSQNDDSGIRESTFLQMCRVETVGTISIRILGNCILSKLCNLMFLCSNYKSHCLRHRNFKSVLG